MLAKPVSVTPGISDRHTRIENRIVRATRPHTIDTNNPIQYDRPTGVLLPPAGGTGKRNVGTITVPHDVDLGTGGGIGPPGSSGVTTGGGTVGAIAKWTGSTALGNAVSGTDYSAPHAHPYAASSHTHPTSEVIGSLDGSGVAGRVAYWSDTDTLTSDPDLTFNGSLLTAGPILTTGASGGLAIDERDGAGQWVLYATGGRFRIYDGASDVVDVDTNGVITSVADTIILGAFTLNLDGSLRVSGAGASTGDVLAYNGTAFIPTALVASDIGAAPSDAKYIVQQSHSGLSAEQALGSLATGILKNTTSTGVLSIAVAGTDYAAASHTHTSANITDFNEAVDDRVDALLVAGSNITLTYNDSGNTLTIAAASGAIDGSGTAGRIAQWQDSNTLEASTLIKSGAGVLTLSASGAFTLTIPKTGTAAVGTGGTNRIAFWTDANTLGSNSPFSYDQTNGAFNIDGSGTWGGGLNVGTASGAGTGDVRGSGVGKFAALATIADNRWELGGYTATVVADTGYLSVEVDNVAYQVVVRRP